MSKITRVTSKLGRDSGFSTDRAASVAPYRKVRRGSKSMGHNVDNLCKHKMLRLGPFPLDRAVPKCNQPISRNIFVSY